MRLDGEIALITGSTSGLGRVIAGVAAAEGALVAITGRDHERGEAAAEAAGPRARFFAADLGDEQQCTALVDAVVAHFGGLTVLVNNAVLNWRGGNAAVTDVATEAWEAALRLNLTAVMWLCRAAIPAMRVAGHGAIVNVSSRAAERASPALAPYIASKGGLNALTRSIAVDYASDGIRCNTVSPGYVLHETRDRDLTDERRARLEGQHLTRLARPDDVARAVVFLASRDAEVITGVNLPVDGGSSIARANALG